MEIKTKKHFNEIINSLVKEILDEEELEEITTTGDVDGYMTPNFLQGKKGKKKKKKISTNSTGYKMIDESIDKEYLIKIRALIRATVADVLRDIWLKRTAWVK